MSVWKYCVVGKVFRYSDFGSYVGGLFTLHYGAYILFLLCLYVLTLTSIPLFTFNYFIYR